jgi:hypothetical protein
MTTTSHTDTSTNGSDVSATARDVASSVADRASAVADRASAAAARLPDAANATGVQLGRANDRIQQESDEVLTVGTTLSLGFALGLLLGGANRILVFLALLPAAAMGYTLFDRHNGSRGMRAK